MCMHVWENVIAVQTEWIRHLMKLLREGSWLQYIQSDIYITTVIQRNYAMLIVKYVHATIEIVCYKYTITAVS